MELDRVVPVSEARKNLANLLDEAQEHEVFLLRHGRPVGVLLSVEAYQAALTRIEDLEDTISVLQAHDSVPFERSDAVAAR